MPKHSKLFIQTPRHTIAIDHETLTIAGDHNASLNLDEMSQLLEMLLIWQRGCVDIGMDDWED